MEGLFSFPATLLWLARDIVFALFVVLAVRVAVTESFGGLLRRFVELLRLLPGAEALILMMLRRNVRAFLKQLDHASVEEEGKKGGEKAVTLPPKGLTHEELFEELKKRKKVEVDPHTGKIFAYVYTSKDERFHTIQRAFDMFEFSDSDGESDSQIEGTVTEKVATACEDELKESFQKKSALVQMFFHAFMHENALNPMVFPGLRRFETEIVSMVGHMLHSGAGVAGGVTSGGTESILMAVKTYRDRARHLFPAIRDPEMVAPITIHPAFEKAASYFDVKVVHVPLKADYTVDMDAYKEAITPHTILLLASAPEYCHGIVDPVEEIAAIAYARGLPLHVDACFGGFMLPWVEKLGYPVPVFDFRLPGVTSMSADIHKYGLGIKGSSVLLYRSPSIRRFQIFAYAGWPGGLFGSPGMAGTRPGGNIASSWAVLQCMGEEGYMDMARRLMKVTQTMIEGINSIEGLQVCGKPSMTAFAIGSCDIKVNVFVIADVMESKGWKMERQEKTIHCTILPSHTLDSAKQFVGELKSSCDAVKNTPSLAHDGTAGMYGMVAKIPDKSIVKDFVVEFINEIYKL